MYNSFWPVRQTMYVRLIVANSESSGTPFKEWKGGNITKPGEISCNGGYSNLTHWNASQILHEHCKPSCLSIIGRRVLDWQSLPTWLWAWPGQWLQGEKYIKRNNFKHLLWEFLPKKTPLGQELLANSCRWSEKQLRRSNGQGYIYHRKEALSLFRLPTTRLPLICTHIQT